MVEVLAPNRKSPAPLCMINMCYTVWAPLLTVFCSNTGSGPLYKEVTVQFLHLPIGDYSKARKADEMALFISLMSCRVTGML